MENWKEIKGYEGIYEVSDNGNVRRKIGIQCKSERLLKPINNGNGYFAVCLSKESKVKRIYIHRIVAMSFLDNKENKPEVNHIDGNRGNNKLSNLEWCTRSENHFHRYKVLKQKGVNYGKTGALNWKSKPVYKLDLDGNILKMYAGVMEAYRQTGICESNIRCCIYGRGKTAGGFKWKYV